MNRFFSWLTTSMGILFIAVVFGTYIGSQWVKYSSAKDSIKQAQQAAHNTAENISARQLADKEQQETIAAYNNAVSEELLYAEKVINDLTAELDRLRSIKTTRVTNTTATGDSCAIERATISELYDQLQESLRTYGVEANRADNNTRLLNVCISALKRDRELLSKYK